MTSLETAWAELGPWLIPVLWMALSAIINAALHYRSPEAWAAWASEHPRLASIMRLVSALGIDPAKAIKAVAAFVRARAGE